MAPQINYSQLHIITSYKEFPAVDLRGSEDKRVGEMSSIWHSKNLNVKSKAGEGLGVNSFSEQKLEPAAHQQW